jgi:hypothetical protein
MESYWGIICRWERAERASWGCSRLPPRTEDERHAGALPSRELPRRGAHRPGGAAAVGRRNLENEFPATVFNAVWLYVNPRSWKTDSRGSRDGSGDDRSTSSGEADGAKPACRRTGYRLYALRKQEGRFLTTQRSFGRWNGGGEATVREIDGNGLWGRRTRAPGAAWSGNGLPGQGAARVSDDRDE